MKKYLILIIVALLIMPVKAQLINVSVEKVTTTAAQTDQRVWDITYWLQISTAQEDIIQVCDSFGHAELWDSWLCKNPGKAGVYSTLFCWVFAGDTIWADMNLSIMDMECYDVSSESPVSTTITMDDTYLMSYYKKHSNLWPSLNKFGQYFVKNACLLYCLDGTYYSAELPKRLSLTYLSNEYIRIQD